MLRRKAVVSAPLFSVLLLALSCSSSAPDTGAQSPQVTVQPSLLPPSASPFRGDLGELLARTRTAVVDADRIELRSEETGYEGPLGAGAVDRTVVVSFQRPDRIAILFADRSSGADFTNVRIGSKTSCSDVASHRDCATVALPAVFPPPTLFAIATYFRLWATSNSRIESGLPCTQGRCARLSVQGAYPSTPPSMLSASLVIDDATGLPLVATVRLQYSDGRGYSVHQTWRYDAEDIQLP